ncbi:MAG: nitroreductase family protein [Nitriliruptorales bacterium]|nr:nitroreductase family protein [Nitriliruptorales bacterium]
MEFAEVVRRRRVVRAYAPETVEGEVLDRVMAATRQAPSAGFSQGQSFVVITDSNLRAAVANCCGEAAAVGRGLPRWVSTAPVLVVPCVREKAYHERYAEPDKRASRPPADWEVPWWWVDGGLALMLLLLATVDEGLSSGLLDLADRDGVRDLLGVPQDVVPLGVVTIGYPAPDRRSSSLARGRRPMHEVVHRNHWGSHAE